MELLISMLKKIMMIICGGISSWSEMQTKIGEAEKYYHVEFFRWGYQLHHPTLHTRKICLPKKRESKKSITEKFHPKGLKMLLVFK